MALESETASIPYADPAAPASGSPISRSHRKCEANPARNVACCEYFTPNSWHVSSTIFDNAGK